MIITRYNRLLAEYKSLAGLPLLNANGEDIYSRPKAFLKVVSEYLVRIDVLSNQIEVRRAELQKQRVEALVNKRKLQGQMRLLNDSLSTTMQFSQSMMETNLPSSTVLTEAHCPICEAQTSTPAVEASKLINAIEWLNEELMLSSYARESFAEERRNIKNQLAKQDELLRRIQDDIRPLDEEINKLKTSKSVDEQALKTKLRLEIAIQEQLDKPESELSGQEKFWQKRLFVFLVSLLNTMLKTGSIFWPMVSIPKCASLVIVSTLRRPINHQPFVSIQKHSICGISKIIKRVCTYVPWGAERTGFTLI